MADYNKENLGSCIFQGAEGTIGEAEVRRLMLREDDYNLARVGSAALELSLRGLHPGIDAPTSTEDASICPTF